MRYFNVLSSLVFTVIGYKVLILNSTFDFKVLEFYTYSALLSFIYIGTQGIGLLFRQPGKQSGFYLDLVFSSIPLFIVYESLVRPMTISDHYTYFRSVYSLAIAIDLVIFTAVAYRFAMMTDEYVTHD